MIGQGLDSSQTEMLVCPHPVPPDRRSKPHPNVLLKCPRCESLETKFCYYNNYSLTQPRYFCKKCKRYWTEGGTLRNVPVGGGLRKNKRSKQRAAGQGDAAAPEAASSAVTDTAIEAKSHVASLNDSSLNADETELRYSNSSANGNYSFDNARMAHQRVYEAGEQASLNSAIPHFGYAEELRNAPRFFPGYGYSYHPAQEAARLPQYDAARYGYNLLDQRQSNSGEMSEVLEAMPSRLNQRSEQHHYQSIQQPLSLIQPEEEEDDEEEDENQGYTKTQKLLPATNELESAGKSVNVKIENQQAASDEASSGVINPYDWQQISEGLFTGMGDYFYLQGGSWPDMSHFDSGTR